MARVGDLAGLLPQARPEDDHDRRPDRLPAPPRQARRARRVDRAADRRSATSRSSATARWSTTSTTSRWSRATSAGKEDVLVRVHSECLTGDVFHSLRCDCGEQLESALAMIEREGEGVLLYLAQEGRGHRPAQQAEGLQAAGGGPTTPSTPTSSSGCPPTCATTASARRSSSTSGCRRSGILTNNPKKIRGLEGYGLSVTEQVPIEHAPNPHNEAYLRAKAERMGHTLHHQGLTLDEEMLHDERRRRRTAREDGAVRVAIVAAVLPRPRRPAGRLARAPASRRPAATASTSSTSPAPTSCRWPRSTARRPGRYAGVGVPRRGHPRRDDPLRLRLRRVGARDHGRPAAHRRPVRVRRADRRPMEQALARAGGDKRDSGAPRRRGGPDDVRDEGAPAPLNVGTLAP